MNFDHIFEDLEAQFESRRNGLKPKPMLMRCNSLRVSPIILPPEILRAPIVGTDFIGGLSSGNSAWNLYPLAQLTEIWPHSEGDPELPAVRDVDTTLIELMQSFAKPTSVIWHWASSFAVANRGMLVGIDCGLLMIESARGVVAVSTRSVAKISVELVDNFDEDLENNL